MLENIEVNLNINKKKIYAIDFAQLDILYLMSDDNKSLPDKELSSYLANHLRTVEYAYINIKKILNNISKKLSETNNQEIVLTCNCDEFISILKNEYKIEQKRRVSNYKIPHDKSHIRDRSEERKNRKKKVIFNLPANSVMKKMVQSYADQSDIVQSITDKIIDVDYDSNNREKIISNIKNNNFTIGIKIQHVAISDDELLKKFSTVKDALIMLISNAIEKDKERDRMRVYDFIGLEGIEGIGFSNLFSWFGSNHSIRVNEFFPPHTDETRISMDRLKEFFFDIKLTDVKEKHKARVKI